MESLDLVLDRMADHILSYEEIEFLDLVQYVWRREWPLCEASKPKDEDPLRLAIKASLLERMVEIWNSPPKNSAEKVPKWCASIPGVENEFSVISPEKMQLWENEPGSEVFKKRNIFAPEQFMFFL